MQHLRPGFVPCKPISDRSLLSTGGGGPLPASVLPRTDVTELRGLLVREKELVAMQDKASRRLGVLEAARASVNEISDEASAADLYRGLPTRTERLDRINQQLGDAVTEQAAIEAGLLATRQDIARSKKALGVAFWKELRQRAAQSDALQRQVEELSSQMDSLEAEASELLGLHHNYGHFDPISLGGWQYYRQPCYVHPDGRRTLISSEKSEYRSERARKIELGLLEAV